MIRSLLILIFLLGASLAMAQDQTTPVKPCQNSEKYRQFDFWIGKWEVKNPDGQLVGHNNIELILDGCVLMENWTGQGASRGKSFNYYNAYTGKWVQKWIDNFGNPLELEGNLKDGNMHFNGTSLNPQGQQIMSKLTFYKIDDNHVRQHWEMSADKGETWQTAFDGHYYRLEN